MQNNENSNKSSFNYQVSHTKHSKWRASQRGISDQDIQTALDSSQSFFKQGLVFHVVKDKLIPEHLSPETKKRIQNLVIIITGKSDQILTCYKNRNSMHRIKRKSETLSINEYAS
jgi:hypothetical protein